MRKLLCPSTSHWKQATDLSFKRLDKIKERYEKASKLVKSEPYDPKSWVCQANFFNTIGFGDLAVHSAYRARLLIEHAQGRKSSYPPFHIDPTPAGTKSGFNPTYDTLEVKVRDALFRREATYDKANINKDLNRWLKDAYEAMLQGLYLCDADWDAIGVVKEALIFFPGNELFLSEETKFKNRFLDGCDFLKARSITGKDLMIQSRTGWIFKRKFPWMSPDLFERKKALVERINKDFPSESCRVGQVKVAPREVEEERTYEQVYGPQPEQRDDAGNLGVFAARDIKAGECIMVDPSLAAVADMPYPDRVCDACCTHVVSRPGGPQEPFIHEAQVCKLECCSRERYCSEECRVKAKTGYHRRLCSRKFDDIFEVCGKDGEENFRFQSMLLTKMLAIILADPALNPKVLEGKPIGPKAKLSLVNHILRHPMIARMATSYTDDAIPNKFEPFTMTKDVDGPANILMRFGIDIFENPHFSPEIINTLLYRITNNAGNKHLDIPAWKASTDFLPNMYNMSSLNPNYLFLNHSCDPNAVWEFASNRKVTAWILVDGEPVLKEVGPGSSTVVVRASKNIKKDEEVRISYIPIADNSPQATAARQRLLEPWLVNGCGCEACAGLPEKEFVGEVDEIVRGIDRLHAEGQASSDAEANLDAAERD